MQFLVTNIILSLLLCREKRLRLRSKQRRRGNEERDKHRDKPERNDWDKNWETNTNQRRRRKRSMRRRRKRKKERKRKRRNPPVPVIYWQCSVITVMIHSSGYQKHTCTGPFRISAFPQPSVALSLFETPCSLDTIMYYNYIICIIEWWSVM